VVGGAVVAVESGAVLDPHPPTKAIVRIPVRARGSDRQTTTEWSFGIEIEEGIENREFRIGEQGGIGSIPLLLPSP
jgi:hypothetical protein